MDRGDQVLVDRAGHVVGKERGIERAGILPGPGVVDVLQDRTAERRGQRVLVSGELLVVLLERPCGARFAWAKSATARASHCSARPSRPFSFVTNPNFMSASCSWRNARPAAWAISPCIASSSSSFLPSVCGLKRSSRSSSRRYGFNGCVRHQLLELADRQRQQLGPNVAGRLRRPASPRSRTGPASAGTGCWPGLRSSSETRRHPTARPADPAGCRTSRQAGQHRGTLAQRAAKLRRNPSMRFSNGSNACSQAASSANRLDRSQVSPTLT